MEKIDTIRVSVIIIIIIYFTHFYYYYYYLRISDAVRKEEESNELISFGHLNGSIIVGL